MHKAIPWGLSVFIDFSNASIDHCVEVGASLEVVVPEYAFVLKTGLLKCAVGSTVRGERSGVKPMKVKTLKSVVGKCADDARHETAPAIRLRQPVAELCTMSACRECSDDADRTDEIARWLTKSEDRRLGVGRLLASIEPPLRIRLGERERNSQQTPGNLRVGKVLHVSSLVCSHVRTEEKSIGDFETEVLAFVHSERGDRIHKMEGMDEQDKTLN